MEGRNFSGCGFRLADADDTLQLGREFGRVAQALLTASYVWNRAARVGICGESGAGKTTLAKGILSGLGTGLTVLDCNNGFKEQGFYSLDNGGGYIQHYDAWVFAPCHMLSTYFNNCAVSQYGLPLVDLVEHPESDLHNKSYDCVIVLDDNGAAGGRTVRVAAVRKIRDGCDFQDFVSAAAGRFPRV